MVDRRRRVSRGVGDDRPWAERLLPWPFYAVPALGCLVLLPFAVTGVGFEHPDRARSIGVPVLVLSVVVGTAFAIVSRRARSRGRGREDGGRGPRP